MEIITLLFGLVSESKLDIYSIATVLGSVWKIDNGIKKREKARAEAELLKEQRREASQKEFSDKIVEALTSHDKKNDERFNKIETHIGLKK